MIASDDFVFLHLPKTGGTFVTAMLTRVLNDLGKPFEILDKHAPYRRMPASLRCRPLIICIRNPFDWIVSRYLFRSWADEKRDLIFRDSVARFPNFPNITFEEFLAWDATVAPISLRAAQRNPFTTSMGWASLRLINFCCEHPDTVIAGLDDAAIEGGAMRDEMRRFTVLRTHRLNEDLHAFLTGLGYPPAVVDFIRTHEAVLPSSSRRTASQHWQDFYSPDLRHEVRAREKMYLRLFPEFDE